MNSMFCFFNSCQPIQRRRHNELQTPPVQKQQEDSKPLMDTWMTWDAMSGVTSNALLMNRSAPRTWPSLSSAKAFALFCFRTLHRNRSHSTCGDGNETGRATGALENPSTAFDRQFRAAETTNTNRNSRAAETIRGTLLRETSTVEHQDRSDTVPQQQTDSLHEIIHKPEPQETRTEDGWRGVGGEKERTRRQRSGEF